MEQKLILLSGKRAEKDQAYFQKIRDISSRIQQLGEAEGMDTGSVLMDVTYLTVASEICRHRDS